MDALHTVKIPSIYGDKYIRVYHADVTDLQEPIDVLGISATRQGYFPSANTLIDALWRQGIHVHELAREPDIDMRRLCKTWLSAPTGQTSGGAECSIGRIGCIEFSRYSPSMDNREAFERSIINKLAAFFRMLDAAESANVPLHTVALPMLGSGAQGIRFDLVLVPMLREIVEYLMRSKETRQILLVDKSERMARIFQRALQSDIFHSSLNSICRPEALGIKNQVFISYSHKDSNVVNMLCDRIKKVGMDVWIADRSIEEGIYADRIANAINQSGIFVPVISRNSLYSQHVISEVNMAFNRMSSSRLLMPLFIDRAMITPAFEYYLNALECAYAIPPTAASLDEFVSKLCSRCAALQL